MADWIAARLEQQFGLQNRFFSVPALPIVNSTPAHHDLRRYTELATLPQMELGASAPALPPSGHTSHANKLAIDHEPYRHFNDMYKIMAFVEHAYDFSMANLPNVPTGDNYFDSESGYGISVPARGFEVVKPVTGKPSKVEQVVKWVMDYPLGTIDHIMRLVYPEMPKMTFEEGRDTIESDMKLMRWYRWCRDDSAITEAMDTWEQSVMVFIQPPWILSPADLQGFANCDAFPSPNSRQPLKAKERLWGKIWDLCSQKRSDWFVLTTYWGWVFGTFSPGHTRAFTSGVIPFDAKEPTVLQCLFFWFTSALAPRTKSQGVWTSPEVPEPIDAYQPVSVPRRVDSMNIAESESSWHASSIARSQSPLGAVSDDSADDDTVMDGTGERRDRRVVTHYSEEGEVAGWVLGVQAREDPRARIVGPPPPPSEISDVSHTTVTSAASAIQDLAAANGSQRHGVLMTGVHRDVRMTFAAGAH